MIKSRKTYEDGVKQYMDDDNIDMQKEVKPQVGFEPPHIQTVKEVKDPNELEVHIENTFEQPYQIVKFKHK